VILPLNYEFILTLSIIKTNFVFIPCAQYADNILSWSSACDNLSIPNEAAILETSIHQHQTIYEAMCQAYTEVSNFEPSIVPLCV